MKEPSPFMPGSPVPTDLFVGRIKQIEEIMQYVKRAASGRHENVFLSGERGIGKSSLASFVRSLASTKENFLTVHVFLGGVSTLEELVRKIFEEILKETNTQSFFSKIKDSFGNYISEIGLFGVSISFNPRKEDLTYIVRNFPEALRHLLDKIGEEKRGIFIVLDDINGISKIPDFAHWYKSFADNVATHYSLYPVLMMPIGLPDIRDDLSTMQPSLMRVFRIVEIDRLSDEDVESFFTEAFARVGTKVLSEGMSMIVKYSSGLPILMHEIGDAVYLLDIDSTINETDAIFGIMNAAEQIGRKYLDPKVYRAIRSDRYRSILRKLGGTGFHFKKHEMERKLSENEKKVFHNFLRRMIYLGILFPDREGGRGSYRYVNNIYPVYIRMESQRHPGK
jgi:hypothetical protein